MVSARGGKQPRMDRSMPTAAGILGDLAEPASPARRLSLFAEAVPRLIPLCCGATATVWDGTAEPLTAATHPDLDDLVTAQFRAGEGPIATAVGTGRPTRAPDLLHEERWPRFRATALGAGIRSSLTTPYRHEDIIVTVTAYGFRPTAPDGPHAPDDGPDGPGNPGSGGLPGILGRLFAEAVVRDRRHAAALATADQLDSALRSRPVVDQACGIVMHVVGVDAATAFDILRRISQRSNRKLSDLAAEVVRTRALRQR
jgi:hypothetical protein